MQNEKHQGEQERQTRTSEMFYKKNVSNRKP